MFRLVNENELYRRLNFQNISEKLNEDEAMWDCKESRKRNESRAAEEFHFLKCSIAIYSRATSFGNRDV